MVTLFESIEEIIKNIKPNNLHVNLMLFNPRDHCYHSYLAHPIKSIDEKKLLSELQKKLEKNDKLKEWIEEWINENTSSSCKKLQFYFSALPSKDNWDVNGFYHKIFIDDKNYNNQFSPLKPAYWVYKESNKSNITCYQLCNSSLKKIATYNYYNKFSEEDNNYKIYHDLYDLLRNNIFANANFEKFIMVPLFINDTFFGTAFSQVPEGIDITNALKEYENLPNIIQPALQNLLLSEFDKFVLKNMDKFKTLPDIIESICENINFILRCKSLECKITHPNQELNWKFAFTKEDEKIWKKSFKKIENNFKTTNDKIVIEFEAKKWKINLTIYHCLRKDIPFPEFSKEKLTQLLHQKLYSIVIPLYENLRKARKSASLQVMSRNTSHGIGARVLSHLSTENSLEKILENLENVENTKKFIPHLFEYIRQRFNTNADIATSGFNILTDKNLKDELIFFYDDGKKKTSNLVFYLISNGKNLEIIITGDEIVAIPNDIYGVHAFFIILENIVRNAVKHMKYDNIQLEIKIENFNDNKELYKVQIVHKYLENYKYKEINFVDRKKLNQIIDYINQPILYEKDKPRAGGWGLLEMKICSAYLRNINLEDIDEPFDPPILKVNDCPFSYEFYLLKPKIATILNPSENKIIKQDKVGFEEIQGNEKINKILKWGTEYRFLILLKEEQCLNMNNESCQLSVEMSRDEINSLLQKQNNDEIIFEILKKFIPKNKNYIICIHHNSNRYLYRLVENNWQQYNQYNELNGNELIVFDNHGENKQNYTGSLLYYEPYPSTSTTSNIITKITNSKITNSNPTTNKLLTELLLSSILNVTIIDERIYKLSEDSKDKFEKMRIKIYQDLNSSYNSTNANGVTLVHLSLIEKKVGTETQQIQNWIEKNKSKKLIIISDRGTPSNIPDGTLYLPFDSILYSLFYARSKYNLYHVINSARKLKREIKNE